MLPRHDMSAQIHISKADVRASVSDYEIVIVAHVTANNQRIALTVMHQLYDTSETISH